jgi:hypothetical protein
MAEPELKLDLPCPRCGTTNLPTAQRCRQCFHEFRAAGADHAPFDGDRPGTGDLFDLFPPNLAAPAEDLGGQPVEDVEAAIGGARLRNAVRARRRADAPPNPSWLNFAWLLRLCSVLFLFWGVVDTSIWLTSTTKALAPSDPAGLRYSVFAIYELVRNLCIVAGVWLLTLLNPRP